MRTIEEETLLLVSKFGFSWHDVRLMPSYKRKLYLNLILEWNEQKSNKVIDDGMVDAVL